MPPPNVIRDFPPDISSSAPGLRQTSSKQSGDSAFDASDAAFLVPLAIFCGVLTICFGACWCQMIRLLSRSRRPATAVPVPIDRAAVVVAVRSARKKKLDDEIKSEKFSKWRAEQLAKMEDEAAFPTQVICIICLSGFAEDDMIRDIKCAHVFHLACLDEWFCRGHNLCPLCKSELCPTLTIVGSGVQRK